MRYVGLDVHVQTTSYCVLDEQGSVVDRGKVATTAPALRALCERLSREHTVVAGQEVGKMSHFVHDVVTPTPVKLLSFNAHHLRMIAASRKKSDRRDAYWIGKALQTGMTPHPVYIPTGEVRELRSLLQQRDSVIRERVRWLARARALLQSHGHKPGKLNVARLSELVESGTNSADGMSGHVACGLLRCQRMALALQQEQQQLEQELQARASGLEDVQRLQTIPGVGPQVALSIYAAVGNIERFGSARELCSYAGLVPTVRQSGATAINSCITRQGNVELRRMLVQAGHTLLWRCKSAEAAPLQALGLRVHTNRRRRKVAVVAAARSILRLAYYILRDKVAYDSSRLKSAA